MSTTNKPKFTEDDIVTREWRFGMHLPTGPNGEDLHLIKEVVTLKDGSKHPNLRAIRDYERPIWAAKMHTRVYQDKKEWESLDKLDMYMCTQSQLRNKVALITGNIRSTGMLSELLVSPYIYGADIFSTSIIHRQMYQKVNEGIEATPYKVAAFDTETDMIHDTGEIIIGSMTMLPYCHLVIRKDFLDGVPGDLDEQIQKVIHEKLGPEIEEHNLIVTHEIVLKEIDIVEKSFQWFHHHKPDWMAIWSMDFDATKILEACDRAGVHPTQILCDPSIPYDYRIARYKRVKPFKKAASGKGKPVPSHDQWNFMYLTASFTMVCAMATYRLLRLGEQEERSYGLDAILDKELDGKVRKLKHPPADMYVKGKWHQVMQSLHKLVYIAYAAMDTISMCILDKKTKDLSSRLPDMADTTDFSQCNSQPKRLRDSFYLFALEERDSVIGCVGYTRDLKPKEEEVIDLGDLEEEGFGGDDDDDDEDGEYSVLSRKDWTLTLASHLSAPGLNVTEGVPYNATGIRAFTYDSDAVSSYPSCGQVSNSSRTTTRKEICRVGNYEEKDFRLANLNLMWGQTNAVEYTTKMFQAPELMTLLDIYDTAQGARH